MRELIRNCTHFNLTHVYLESDQDHRPFRTVKVAFSRAGADSLVREYEGNVWYATSRAKNPASCVTLFLQNPSYATLELAYQPGEAGDPGGSITRNEGRLRSAISHYMDVFGRTGFSRGHGDFSLENMLFRDGDLLWVLDWEHFNSILTGAFDPLYLVIESVYFSALRHRLRARDLRAAWNLIRHVEGGIGIPEAFFRGPCVYLRKQFLENREVFGRQLMKYPLVNSDLHRLERLDARLLGAL